MQSILCDYIEINDSFYKEYKKEEKATKKIIDVEAKNIGIFMLKFNQLDKNYLQPCYKVLIFQVLQHQR